MLYIGVSVGGTVQAEIFLTASTLHIVIMELFSFTFGKVGGVLLGKVMYKLSGGKINSLIGSVGVSAVPIVARVFNVEGLKAKSPTIC